MQLILVRHGESHVNLGEWENLISMDAGLTDKGHQQAAALRDWLKQTGVSADVLYCSSMLRARETAGYLAEALQLDPIVDDRIREIGNNYLTGLPVEEDRLPRSFTDRWVDSSPFVPRTVEFENAESWMHFRIRLAHFIDEIAHKHNDERVYVVAHGGAIAAMMDNMFNVGPYRRCDIHNDNTGWTWFEHRVQNGREPWYLRGHNRVDHLVGAGLI